MNNVPMLSRYIPFLKMSSLRTNNEIIILNIYELGIGHFMSYRTCTENRLTIFVVE